MIHGTKLWGLVVLRILIGWHFLYEGLTKLMNPDWSSVGFLLDSQGVYKPFFDALSSHPTLLGAVDLLNIWGLILVGIGLILGIFANAAAWGGIALLALYYLSHPPMIGLKYSTPSEGNYLWVNKNLIELVTLYVLYLFPTSHRIGIDRLIFGRKG